MTGGRYSLLRYSVNQESSIAIAETFVGELKGIAGPAIFVPVVEEFSAYMSASGRITASIPVSADFVETMGGSAKPSANVDIVEDMPSALNGSAYAAQDIYIEAKLETVMGGGGYMAYDTPASLDADTELHSNVVASKNITDTGLFAGGVLFGNAGAGIVENKTVTINITIPPGGELRIDSEFYTVLLDGKNVLYAQSGDWAILSRDLVELSIASTSGGPIEGEVFFAERWL